ncbi:MAG: MFS transporter [Chitinophagaceae bacterium]|nr:MFS transporter [Chitinophagaceae bacterium]
MTNQLTTDPFQAFRITEFRNFAIARFLFIMGLRMMGTLVGWWMYELTNDPLALGIIGLAEVIPAVSMALYAGHVVDQSDRRNIVIRSVLFYGICVALLLFVSTAFFQQQFGKSTIILLIYIIIFITGIIRAFSGPSFGAIISQLVPRNSLPNAVTWSQGTWLSASVTGHALAGFLIAGFGITGTLTAIILSISLALLIFNTIAHKPAPPQSEKKTWESVKEGIRYVYKTKEILGALVLDLFAVLFGGAVALVPVFAKDILKVGPIGFGWLNAAADFGAILVVIILTVFPLRKQQGKVLLFAVAGFGVTIIIFGLSELFWLSFAALFVGGILDGISIVVRGTIVQLKTPDALRGRVMSVNSMFINSSNELGQFESGVMAKLMGVVPSVIFGGCMTVAVVIATWFKAPTLRKLEYE